MRSYAVLLALLPLSFAAPNVHLRDEVVDRGLLAGRSCVLECQTNFHMFPDNLSKDSLPRYYQEYCESAKKLSECFEKCPESPASPLVKQNVEINARICGKDFDAETFEEFVGAQIQLGEQWFLQTITSCPKESEGGKCSHFLDCFFGDALNAVKDGYDDLVVASIVVPMKLESALEIGGGVWTEEVVDQCSVLFSPYEANHTDPSSLSAPSCLLYCGNTAAANHTGNRRANEPPKKALYCEYKRALDDCLGKCQVSPITPVVKQHADVTARICAPDFSEEQLRAFFVGQSEMGTKWLESTGRCRADGPGSARAFMEPIYEKCRCSAMFKPYEARNVSTVA